MPRTALILILLSVSTALVGPAGSASALPDPTPQERAADAVVGVFFDSSSAAAALTPRDAEDDARVDRWLALCADLAAGRPLVQAAMHRRLIERAQSRRGGEVEALEHWLALAKAQPGHRWVAQPQRVAMYAQAYDAVSRDREARGALAEPYIEALLAQAQRNERAWEIPQASDCVRTATSVARTNSSPYESVLETYGRSLETLRRESTRLTQLRARVEGGQASAAEARALALRLACDRSDLQGAAAAADLTGDDDFAQLMQYAAQPAYELEPMQTLAVAELFRAAADDPALTLDRARLSALMEARFYYQHFLFGYTSRDVIRLRALDLADGLAPSIAALQPEPIRRPPGRWRTLTNNIAEPRVGNSGNLVRGQHLRVRNNTVYAHSSAFSIPATIDESYDFRMIIKLTHANDRNGMSLYFPIGGTGAHLQLGNGGGDGSRLDKLNQPFNLPNNFRFPEDTAVPLELAVHRKPHSQVHLVVTLGGRELLDWTGPIRAIATDNNRPPQRHGNTFRVGAGTTYEFSQIETRRAGEE